MKRGILSLFVTLLAGGWLQAQTLTYESSMQAYGYKNDNGTWKIAPRYQRAGEFEG